MTCFECLLGYSRLHLINAKSAKGADIGDICIEDTYISDTFVGSTCIEGTYIEGIYIDSACIKNTFVKSIYISGINAVKRLKILLQSSQILEVGLFNLG